MKKMRFKSLDAFRGIAILWVMARHFMHPLGYPQPIQLLADYGYWGVQIFLIISGFGISAVLFRSKKIKPWDFFQKRFTRILLPYWASLVFAAFLIPSLQSVLSFLKGAHNDYYFHLSFVEWLRVITLNYFLPVTYPDWYLAVIVQIYAVAALALLTKNTKQIFWGLTLLSWGFILLVKSQSERPLFFLFYWAYFSVGFILHELVTSKWSRSRSSLHFLPAIMAAAVFVLKPDAVFFSLFIGALLWPIYLWDEEISRLTWVKGLIFLGSFSYSIYLMHVPLRGIIRMTFSHVIPIPDQLFVPLIQIPLTVLISYFWYLAFEKKLAEWFLSGPFSGKCWVKEAPDTEKGCQN